MDRRLWTFQTAEALLVPHYSNSYGWHLLINFEYLGQILSKC